MTKRPSPPDVVRPAPRANSTGLPVRSDTLMKTSAAGEPSFQVMPTIPRRERRISARGEAQASAMPCRRFFLTLRPRPLVVGGGVDATGYTVTGPPRNRKTEKDSA